MGEGPSRTLTSAPLPSTLERRYLLGFDAATLPHHTSDVLVIGSGIAGLVAALEASRTFSVTLVTKATLVETSTWYAQGGIAGAVGEADSVELHLADTLVVGQGLCDERVVRAVVEDAPSALAGLRRLGVRFDLEPDGGVALAREGGHSLPRVLHSGDATGAAIQDALTAAVRASDRIRVHEHRFLVDLLTTQDRCDGAVVADCSGAGDMLALEVFRADAVVLATGGSGQVYRVTTNPSIATGDGVAAAWRAGAEIADLEFVQFHPTALDSAASPRFLITEALRGEGAYLLDCDHERFMVGVDPLAELAPRDVVTREIEKVMRRCGRPNVWLDARHLGEPLLRSRFPTIWRGCLEAGYDLASDLVPVAPAAHYQIGGVRIDLDGRTSLPGLYASGEVTASGLHGANRLASNSLLEGLVFSRRIAHTLEHELESGRGPTVGRRAADPGRVGALGTPDASAAGPAGAGSAAAPDEVGGYAPEDARVELQAIMSSDVGATRTADGLADAAARIARLFSRAPEAVHGVADLEMRNLATVAASIVRAALIREESRGVHARLEFPMRDDARWRGHVVFSRGVDPRFDPVADRTETEGDPGPAL